MQIYWQLIISFVKIGCLTIGGGYAMLPLIQQEIERHGWLTHSQFLDILAIAEMTPGPLAVNIATFIGYRTAGITGSLIATAALALPSLVAMTILAAGWQRYRKHSLTQSIMFLLRPVVAGLIVAAALKLIVFMFQAAPDDTGRLMALITAAGAFLCIYFTKINPALIMLAAGVAGFFIFR